MVKRYLPGVLLLAVLPGGAWAAPGGDDWKYDVVYRKKGAPLRGLVIGKGLDHVRIRCIDRKPGRPTVLFTHNVPREEVERLELLDAADREVLRKRVEALRRQREVLAARLKALEPGAGGKGPAGDVVELGGAAWAADPRARALAYSSAHFRLVSDARPEVVQLAAVQLEQVYAAYARFLPPRVSKAPPTTVLLMKSLAEYREYARRQGLELFNAAYYDADKNEVVCGSDLGRLGDDLQRVHRYHEKLGARLKEKEAELARAYRGKVPAELMAPITEARKKIRATEEGNRRAFVGARDRLFRRLYHEAFHAYLANFVYPPREGPLPRWLNEGLAQVFETAIVEAGELRVGHADEDRLDAVRRALRGGELLPVADLLRSGPKQFLASHAADRHVTDRHYLASWALTFYLTFERRLLGTRALDDYVHALQRGTDPLEAFRTLVGQPLPRFEQDFHDYLRRLKSDGTVGQRK